MTKPIKGKDPSSG